MINFLYIVSTRENLCSSYYFQYVDKSDRAALESDVVKKCVSARDSKCSFLEYKEYKIIHRQYNTLLFIVGTDEEENELAIYEFIQLFVEALDKYFNTVNEQHVSFFKKEKFVDVKN
ncbi:AP-4 complex subunit sigma-1-like [Centruroides vittatus]|uniref:AP-4 complex subunit sigma-1-like n=1 Tax=Centruroides vittatus TaxID=120091 RepID=UPI003510A02B